VIRTWHAGQQFLPARAVRQLPLLASARAGLTITTDGNDIAGL
jgi:hypothetical protein